MSTYIQRSSFSPKIAPGGIVQSSTVLVKSQVGRSHGKKRPCGKEHKAAQGLSDPGKPFSPKMRLRQANPPIDENDPKWIRTGRQDLKLGRHACWALDPTLGMDPKSSSLACLPKERSLAFAASLALAL